MSSKYLLLCIFIICPLFLSSSICFTFDSGEEYLISPFARSHPLRRYGNNGRGYYPNNHWKSGRYQSSSFWNFARGRRSHGYWHPAGSDSITLGWPFHSSAKANAHLGLVKVDEYGAKGDGRTDDTEAFKKAWKVACSSERGVFVVPNNGIYHLKPITFSGPCQSGFKVKIYGKIRASKDPSDYERDTTQWLVFENLDDLRVEGGGSINGNGKNWWSKSCKVDTSQPCKTAPTVRSFYFLYMYTYNQHDLVQVIRCMFL
ncbi:hypothetical protein CRG98_043947 [Punica granatum]|uniref:Pectate lyase superfamily protein domain-containing protein n=1 Tax=Punica granatum TaxID=22663 RepID=A0A2I0HWN2_PUNGR|nr:hypothetical protein CRG98_043947 [Punica granatum]